MSTGQSDLSNPGQTRLILFQSGADGSRSIKTVQINADGTGKNFVPATMIVNGDAVRASVSDICTFLFVLNKTLHRILRVLARNR